MAARRWEAKVVGLGGEGPSPSRAGEDAACGSRCQRRRRERGGCDEEVGETAAGGAGVSSEREMGVTIREEMRWPWEWEATLEGGC